MNFVLLGISTFAFPIIHDFRLSKEERIKLNVIINIYKKYQLVTDSTDISKLSEDYAIVVAKPVQTEEIIDPEMGIKFKGVTGINRSIEIIEDTVNDKTVQTVKYRSITNEELKNFTYGQFTSNKFDIPGQNSFLKKIKLRNNFFFENYKSLDFI